MKELFRKLAYKTSEAVGSAPAFVIALLIIVAWGVSGPMFGYSDTWQLVINTGTTIVTFLVVFLIQHTQNRDAKILQLKLDELLRAVAAARTRLVGLEDLPDEEIERLHKEFQRLAKVREEKKEKKKA
jgi:low affinity Fe/Cu permease